MVRFKYGVARLCNQCLSEFSSIQFDFTDITSILEMCMWLFAHKNIFFDKITAILTEISGISHQHRLNILEGHG